MQCGQGLLVYFRVHNGKFNLLSTPIEAMRLQAHGEASSGGMAHAKHPHTGVPEIGHLACAVPPSQRVARCWCLCEGGARDYRKHATVFAARLGVCRLTDFWYSSMRASDKCPAGRTKQKASAPRAHPSNIARSPLEKIGKIAIIYVATYAIWTRATGLFYL